VRLHHRFDGPDDAPVLVLSSSIGTTLELWDAQVPAFAGPFQIVRYDQLGHGRSEVPPGPYTVELLARELLGLLDGLGVDRFSFCGLSLGGTVGMWLGANAGDRIDRLVLAGTSPYWPPEMWIERARLARAEGMEPIADATMGRWFTPATRERPRSARSSPLHRRRATPPAAMPSATGTSAATSARSRCRRSCSSGPTIRRRHPRRRS
jgi:3-oxoadipate enol-lactonase